MTLYRQFGGKDALVAAALEQWSIQWLHRLSEAMWTAAATARGPLRRPLGRAGGVVRRGRLPRVVRGQCRHRLRGEPDHPAQARIAQHRQALRQLLEDLAKAAGAYDPAVLAAQLQILVDGAISAASVDHDSTATAGARALATAAITRASAD